MTERISYVGLDYYVVGLEGGTNWEISLEQWEVLIWIIIRTTTNAGHSTPSSLLCPALKETS